MAEHDENMEGIPHRPGTVTQEVEVQHPATGETHTIHVPADHDGSRIKVEFPEVRDDDGSVVTEAATGWIDGWDPNERALAGTQALVPCGTCGAPHPFAERFTCSVCGAENRMQMVVSQDAGEGQTAEG